MNRSHVILQDLQVMETAATTAHKLNQTGQKPIQRDLPSLMIGSPGCSSEEVEEGMKLFKQFIGPEHSDCANAIARIMNQTLFSSSEMLGSGADRELPTKGITRDQHQKFHDTDVQYYASTARGLSKNSQLSYTLTKENEGDAEPPYYLLEATTAGPSKYLFLTQNSTDPEKELLAMCTDPNLAITQKTSTSYKITPDPAFNQAQEVTAENFPCTIECLALSHHYSIDPATA